MYSVVPITVFQRDLSLLSKRRLHIHKAVSTGTCHLPTLSLRLLSVGLWLDSPSSCPLSSDSPFSCSLALLQVCGIGFPAECSKPPLLKGLLP